jgi:alanine racemase
MVNYNLEPEIYSIRILNTLVEMLSSGYHQNSSTLPIHIKLDTGMHRLGFTANQIPTLLEKLRSAPMLQVKSVFSHLAASDENAHTDFTHHQIDEFITLSQQLIEGIGYPVLRHILNSAGISRYPDAHFNMVRLGIGLYGVATDPAHTMSLSQIGRLKTSITQIKDIPMGESVGYNRSFVAGQASRIAILPIGYADGLSRKLGNHRGKVMINNTFAPIIGNVCMDMIIVDVTNIDASEGDDVIIFGPEYPINELAAQLETIPYEVLTGVSRRVKRVYYHE